MPHLSQLQRDHSKDGLTVIGVTGANMRNTLEQVTEMVTAKGDTMGYTVAFDDSPKTSAGWMDAAGMRGIPSSFLVDKAGKIAWMGHPMSADLPLAMILDGTWDYEKGPKLLEEISEEQRSIFELGQDDPAEALKRIDALYEKHPVLKGSMDDLAFNLLLEIPERADEAAAFGGKLIDAAIAEKSEGKLNQIAWGLVDPEVERAERHLPLALRAAEAAVEITEEKDGAILDTLARVHFWKGDYTKALEIQRKAVEVADERMKPSLLGAVAEYEKALKEAEVGAGK